MTLIPVETARRLVLKALGVDAAITDLAAPAVVTAAIRRAASLRCPCSERALLRASVDPLKELVADAGRLEQIAEDVIEALVAYGDLSEQRDVARDGQGTLLYLTPPSFVARSSGNAVLLGIACDHASPLAASLSERLKERGHVRWALAGARDLRAELTSLGLIELSDEAWLSAPAIEAAEVYLQRVKRTLEAAGPSGDVPGLQVIDPRRSPSHYRGRWCAPKGLDGQFVAKRPQAYGADLWCFVELRDGVPRRLTDLPLTPARHRGCDDAWRLQMAIDACKGTPQRFRTSASKDGSVSLTFPSPVPMWARRRLDALGAATASPGALFAYQLDASEFSEEIRFLRERLWLAPVGDEPTPAQQQD